MNDIAIIGAGSLGTALGYALSKKGFKIKALSCRSISSVKESHRIIGTGKAFTNNIQTAKEAQLIFICVPDEEISKVADEFASSNLCWSNRFVFHCSGLLSSEILKPLADRGALIASFHPVQSFSQKKGNLKQFKGIYFGLEGDEKALHLARKIIHLLGGYSILIKAEDKPLYHAACSMASNFFVLLLDMAASLLKSIGLEEERAFKTIIPLVQGTLQNVKELNIEASLTGPVIRGDSQSVEKHLESLRKFPAHYDLYLRLAAQALEIAKRKNLPSKKIKTLKKLLEGK